MRVGILRGFCLIALLAALALRSHVSAQKPAAGNPATGKQIYNSAVPKCSTCHKIGNSGGKLGPDLSAVGTKRDAVWLATYLPNPQRENPKNKMPPVKVTGQDLADLIAYLRTLRGK